MLEVHCPEELIAARTFADTLGPKIREQLESKLSYLENYAQGKCTCELYRDSSPYSFYFNMMETKPDGTKDRWFNGGLIYHGPHSSGVGFPEFSVVTNPQAEPHWGIHT